MTTVRTLCQIGFTSGNCSWQRVTKYWAAVSADFHGAPPLHGSCCLGPLLWRSPHQELRWLQMCLRGSWAGRWTPHGPGCTCWLFVCGRRTSVWWDSCPWIPCLLSLRRHCPQMPSAALWGEEPWPGVLSNTGGYYGSSPVPFQGCHRVLWGIPNHGNIWWHQSEELVRVNVEMLLL